MIDYSRLPILLKEKIIFPFFECISAFYFRFNVFIKWIMIIEYALEATSLDHFKQTLKVFSIGTVLCAHNVYQVSTTSWESLRKTL